MPMQWEEPLAAPSPSGFAHCTSARVRVKQLPSTLNRISTILRVSTTCVGHDVRHVPAYSAATRVTARFSRLKTLCGRSRRERRAAAPGARWC